jgi:hypothetical protein
MADIKFEVDTDLVQLSEKELKEVDERVSKEVEKNKDIFKQDLLESTDKVPGQNYIVLSFAGEKQRPVSEYLGLKVWGAFNTEDEAKEHATFIGKSEENRNYNVFVMQMYNWSVIPPNLEHISDVDYHNDQLDNMVKTHHSEIIKARELFDMRTTKLTNPKEEE